MIRKESLRRQLRLVRLNSFSKNILDFGFPVISLWLSSAILYLNSFVIFARLEVISDGIMMGVLLSSLRGSGTPFIITIFFDVLKFGHPVRILDQIIAVTLSLDVIVTIEGGRRAYTRLYSFTLVVVPESATTKGKHSHTDTHTIGPSVTDLLAKFAQTTIAHLVMKLEQIMCLLCRQFPWHWSL
jgi:hypothetical protein